MERMIGVIGAFDQNGVFGIGLHLPWGKADGRSKLALDMGRFVQVTRKTLLSPEKKNVLIVGKNTAETFGWNPLPGRRLIILSQTLDEKSLNAGREDSKKVAVARNAQQALECALAYEDCGHIFFAGGETVWLEAINSGACNSAFITVVQCDSTAKSEHTGEVRKMPHMLDHATYNLPVQIFPFEDMWDETPVMLEFRNYMKN